jgi:ornithine cyclodeaminase/alanine dehydrogenase
MAANGTLLLSRSDVASLLTLDECIAAVEAAFRRHGEGKVSSPKVLEAPSTDGGFHIKTALLELSAPYFAAKLNGNFFHNQQRFAMPNIQGLIVLCDAANGYPLAVMDSIEITILRTGAATAVAARHLARPDSKVITVCGCGNQGRVQLRALRRVLPFERAYAFDLDGTRARAFAAELSRELEMKIEAVDQLRDAVLDSDVCVTSTPAKRFVVHKDHVRPGAFVAAVGADNPEKQELDPQLFAGSKVVADILEQCAVMGDLHHAIAAGVIARGSVHAELGELVAGKKPGRTSPDEITIFDSTGTALQDVAAAAVVYEKAVQQERGSRFRF